jgi:hypothetical protein
MANPKIEILMLRSSLLQKGIPEYRVNDICDQAASEMESDIMDAVSDAYEESVEHGVNLGAQNYMAELRPVHNGSTFRIISDSGRTDFSEPPFPMLSNLLKNAEMAKDGSLYKRIPVGKKTPSSSGKRVAFSVFDVIADINQRRAEIKEQRRAKRKDKISDPMIGAQRLADAIAVSRQRNSGTVQPKGVTSSYRAPEIKTASSKQNPQQMWVRPARHLDMTGILMNINTMLENRIDSIIRSTIAKYEGTV